MRLSNKLRLLAIFVLALATVPLAYSEDITQTQVAHAPAVVRIATALNHISIVQLPEEILSAACGSEAVHMEWHDTRVLIQPLKPGVGTNLFVWTAHLRRTYEILPAGDASAMSYLTEEVLPPPPDPPPGPSAEQVQKATDAMLSAALLNTRSIRASHSIAFRRRDVRLRVEQITEDKQSYYVRLSLANHTREPYRINPITVDLIEPAFSGTVPQGYMNRQISDHALEAFGTATAHQLQTHGSTLDRPDVAPGGTAEWIVAVNKPKKTPGIYRFSLPGGGPVHAIAVF